MKVDPATLKVGDEVRWVMAITGGRVIREVAVSEIAAHGIRLGMTWAAQAQGTWFVRKPKKAKPEPDLVEGHDAKFWFGRWEKQLNHNEQLQAVNSGRRVKMQRLEKEVNDARKYAQYWQDKYAVLAASINEVPDEPTPPTRPDEPPVGSFFRVDRTGGKFLSIEPNGDYRYLVLDRATDDWPSDTRPWDEITEPGDTITMLELREVGK